MKRRMQSHKQLCFK